MGSLRSWDPFQWHCHVGTCHLHLMRSPGDLCAQPPVRRAPLKGWPQGVWLGMGLAGCDPPLPVSSSLGSRRKMSPEDGQREGSHYQQELPIQGI